MKKKFDIQLNPKRLTSEQIARHKDFGALLEKLRQQPLPARPLLRHLQGRRLWYIGAAAAVAAVLAGWFLLPQILTPANSYEQKVTAYFAARPYVQPPVAFAAPAFAAYRVNPVQGGTFAHDSGSRLVVPSGAFADEKGQPLTGDVTLHYREMHDFVDFFMAGIPMTYDSAGVNYNLESAGMIEIFAEQNGKRVYMAPGKAINVELVSRVNVSPSVEVPPGYNIYKLDEQNRRWTYQQIDRMQALETEPAAVQNLDESSPAYAAQKALHDKLAALQMTEVNELAIIEASLPGGRPEPVKPLLANGSGYVFDLDFKDLLTGKDSVNSNSELVLLYKKYGKMLWQLAPSAQITPEKLQQEFSQVSNLSIRKTGGLDYELTLQKNNQALTVPVTPVLNGADYEKALTEFNVELGRWQEEKAQREQQLAARKQAVRQQMQQERAQAAADFDKNISALRAKGLSYAANDEIIRKKVLNRFTASEFGIWNCDRPLPPRVFEMKAKFADEQGRPLENLTGYLVDKSRNTVYRFLAEDGAPLRFDFTSQNLLWLMTDDQRMVIFRPDDFKKIPEGADNHTFVMQALHRKIENENDVREVLYL